MASANENQAEQQAPHLTDEQANTRARSRRTDRRGLPSWLTIALVVLTCISLLASTMAVWVDATLLNTDRFVGVVGPLGRDPQAVASVSQYVADQVVAALDIASRTASALPVGGKFLAGPLEQTIHDFVQTRTEELLSSAQAQAAWVALERSVQSELVAALRGQTSNVQIANGALTVDLLPLIAASLNHLLQAAPGLIPSGVTIPTFSGAQSPSEERQRLSQALGTQLAPDFGVVTLLQSDTLTAAQRTVSILDTLNVVSPIITLLLVALTIWSAADRRHTVLLLGIGTAALFLVAILLMWIVLGRLTDAVTTSPAREIAQAVVGPIQASLFGTLIGVLIAGALVALVAYLAGKPAWLTQLFPQNPTRTRGRMSWRS
jgi:hypothetical protein